MSSGNTIGKRKIVMNKHSYGSLPNEEWSKHTAGALESDAAGVTLKKNPNTGFSFDNDIPQGEPFTYGPIAQETNTMCFLASTGPEGDYGLLHQDRLRVALGYSWANKSKTPRSLYQYPDGTPDGGWENDEATKLQFDNSWAKYSVFYGRPLSLTYCGDKTSLSGPGMGVVTADDIPQYASMDNTFWLEESCITKRRIELFVKLNSNPNSGGNWWKNKTHNLNRFKKLIYGEEGGHPVEVNGRSYPGIISFSQTYVNTAFRDHHHEAVSPFTKSELKDKNIHGKVLITNARTYYDSVQGYAGGTGTVWSSHPDLQGQVISRYYENSINADHLECTALPNIYGLMSIINGKFDLNSYYKTLGGVSSGAWLPNGPVQGLKSIEESQSHWFEPLSSNPFETLLTLGGLVDKTSVEKLIATNPSNANVDAFFENYFNDVAGWFNNSLSTKYGLQGAWYNELFDYYKKTMLENKFKNIAFGSHILSSLGKVDTYKKYFPFYSEIEFSTQQLTSLGDKMKSLLQTSFFSKIVAGSATEAEGYTWNKNNGLYSEDYMTYHVDDFYPNPFDHHNSPHITSGDLVSNSFRTFNLFSIMAGADQDFNSSDYFLPPESASEDNIHNFIAYLRDEKHEMTSSPELNNAVKALLGGAFTKHLVKTYKEHYRDWEDIMNGVPAYTEDVLYRIEKWEKPTDASDEAWHRVQNIIVPNTSELNLFKYIDTQVRYGASHVYRYNVYTYRAVFGSKYYYVKPDGVAFSNNEIEKPSGQIYHQYQVAVDVVVVPDVVLVEDLYFSTPVISIMDSPPPPPEASIVPFRAVDDRVLIMLNGSVDTFNAEPISILPSDDEFFRKIRESQLSSTELYIDTVAEQTFDGGPKIKVLDKGKIKFSSDDVISSFQIFKTSSPPQKWTDFDLYVENLSETSLVDNVLPNKKYYYTFRSVDEHGHISNPTPIYEVELISEHGAVKPIIRHYEFPEDKPETPIKDCQKYIYIKPSLKQVYSKESSDSLNYMFTEPPYGDADGEADPVSKKRFKVRLTSKSTGKKIDINLAFVKKPQ